MLDVVACQSCAGHTIFTTELTGHRVYWCEACRRYTWMTRRAQQQQQQPQASGSDEGTG